MARYPRASHERDDRDDVSRLESADFVRIDRSHDHLGDRLAALCKLRE
jgi:hypothetical protein